MTFNKNMKTIRRRSSEETVFDDKTSLKIPVISERPTIPVHGPKRSPRPECADGKGKIKKKTVSFSSNTYPNPNIIVNGKPKRPCFKWHTSNEILLRKRIERLNLSPNYPFAQRKITDLYDVRAIENNNVIEGFALVYVDPDTHECHAMCTEKFQLIQKQYYINPVRYYMSNGTMLSDVGEFNPDGTLPEGHQLSINKKNVR